VYHLLELLIFIIDRDCVLREVGAEVQETFEHRAITIVNFEYRRLRRADCKVATYDNTMMIDCDWLEGTEIQCALKHGARLWKLCMNLAPGWNNGVVLRSADIS